MALGRNPQGFFVDQGCHVYNEVSTREEFMAKNATQKKRKAREKRLKRQRNIVHNRANHRFILEVDMPDEGWKNMAGFRDQGEIDKYIDETQAIRDKGDTRIFAGHIFHIKSRKTVARIKAFEPPQPKHDLDTVKNLEKSEEKM